MLPLSWVSNAASGGQLHLDVASILGRIARRARRVNVGCGFVALEQDDMGPIFLLGAFDIAIFDYLEQLLVPGYQLTKLATHELCMAKSDEHRRLCPKIYKHPSQNAVVRQVRESRVKCQVGCCERFSVIFGDRNPHLLDVIIEGGGVERFRGLSLGQLAHDGALEQGSNQANLAEHTGIDPANESSAVRRYVHKPVALELQDRFSYR